MFARNCGAILIAAAVLSGCASLGGLGIQAPRFEAASGHQAELRLVGPSMQRPMGGAAIRLYARVSNPNPMGLTLSMLAGNLALEGVQAAQVELPLGLPLPAARDTVIPLDIIVGFSELPGLADVVTRALTRGTMSYNLNGTVGVDAGVLGRPTFGPMTLLQGNLQTMR